MPAAFRCLLGDFDATTAFEKLGHLIAAGAEGGFNSHFHKQTSAWTIEILAISTLAAELTSLLPRSRGWSLLLEYEIPRREKRPDAVLLADDVIFVLEFKIGQDAFLSADEWQVYSYALDLRDFHAESEGRPIVPVLVVTDAQMSKPCGPVARPAPTSSLIYPVQRTDAQHLAACITQAYLAVEHEADGYIDPIDWEHSAYRPTPTIIEAAASLFAGHGVAGISHAFATNLTATTETIVSAIHDAERDKRRAICFVTGIPGAGKTLAGLNAVHDPRLRLEGRPPAIFLSGNGPLVKIIREALIRDQQRIGTRKGDAAHTVSTFIANVHGFLVHHGVKQTARAPAEHAIVFDEAQRAWTSEAVQKRHGVTASEPALILEIMERAAEWCAVVALIGGGQEIHQGEAGLEEWGRALNARSQPWRVVVSPETMLGGVSVAGHHLFEGAPAPHLEIVHRSELHLDVSARSPRAQLLGQWVNNLLSSAPASISGALLGSEFPIALTRDLNEARHWLRGRSDAIQRAGLLTSSGAIRLRSYGIEVSSGFRKGYPYVEWFLAGSTDTRSSMWLEVVATEFECQGLEIDWAGICWGDDLVISPSTLHWTCRKFRGTRWQSVKQESQKQYVLNKYRVLLTRARRGMVIWVPPGDPSDPTRDPRLLDATADYLHQSGIPFL